MILPKQSPPVEKRGIWYRLRDKDKGNILQCDKYILYLNNIDNMGKGFQCVIKSKGVNNG